MSDNNSPEDTTPLSVQTVDSKGKAPKRRVATITAAWSSYTKARNANMKRDQRFADIAGIYAGFPPTPPITQERNGMADMPNINTKQFQAKVDTYRNTWMAMAAQGDGYVEVLAEHDDPMEAERRGKVLTEEVNSAIRRWDNPDFEQGNQYILETAARDTQMALFGVGISFFPDSIDFRFKMIPTRRVMLPEGTRLSMDNTSAMWIEDQMSVTDLYQKSDLPGWNKGAILRNLYEHVELTSQTSQRRFTYSEWVNQIRNNDAWLLSEFLPVRLIHMFTKEFDGTITHSTFTDLFGSGKTSEELTKEKGEDADSFIYDKKGIAKRWQQVIVPFADNAGPECDWHGVKGFGDLIFDGCHLNNLMFNRAAMGAVVANMLMFKGMSESDTQKLDQITMTQFGIMAPGLELEQVRFQADIEGALAIVGTGSQFLAENTRISPQNDKTTTGEQPTATQVTADRADRAQFSTLQIMVYRSVGLDVLFSEMYRRLAQPESKYPVAWGGGEVAKRFRDRCAKRGIPDDELMDVKCVRANRNIGSGDLSLDLMKGKELMGIATPGKGQLNARKEIVAALKGVEMVSSFVEEEEPQPGQSDVQINTENSLIQLGQAPIAYGFQEQEKHIASHMQLMAEAAQAVTQITKQGISPQEIEGAKKLSNLMAAGIAHIGQHIQLMASIPRAGNQPALYEKAVAELTKQLNNMQQLEQSLLEDIQKADVQAQPPQQSPEMMKAQQDMQIKQAQAQQDMELKDKAHHAKLGNLAVTTQARTQMKVEDHQLSSQFKDKEKRQQLFHQQAQNAQGLTIKEGQSAQDEAHREIDMHHGLITESAAHAQALDHAEKEHELSKRHARSEHKQEKEESKQTFKRELSHAKKIAKEKPKPNNK